MDPYANHLFYLTTFNRVHKIAQHHIKMGKLLIFIATILLVQLVAANTVPASEDNIFLNILNTAESKVTELSDRLFSFIGVSDRNEAAEKIVTDSKAYANKLSGLIDEIKEKAKSSTGELSESATLLTNKLTEIVGKLEAETPELKQYRETLQTSLNNVVEVTKEFSSKAEPVNTEVQQLLQRVLTSTKDVAESVSTTVESAIKNA